MGLKAVSRARPRNRPTSMASVQGWGVHKMDRGRRAAPSCTTSRDDGNVMYLCWLFKPVKVKCNKKFSSSDAPATYQMLKSHVSLVATVPDSTGSCCISRPLSGV